MRCRLLQHGVFAPFSDHPLYADARCGSYSRFASSRSLNFWILPVEVLGIGPNTT